MRKISISPRCLALAGLSFLSAPLWAQSAINISGLLDIGFSKKTGGATQLGTISRSNIQFQGAEDLGGGLAAIFTLSTRFDIDTGTLEDSDAQRPFWKAESTVGLKGNFGKVRLGRALTPIWDQGWKYDPWDNFDRIASPQWWQASPDFLTEPQTREYSRLNNGIFYSSPAIGPVTVHLSLGVEKQADDRARSTGASVNYDDGKLSLMLGGERNSQKDKTWFAGVAYAFNDLRLMAGYNRVDLDPQGLIYGPQWTNWSAASTPHRRRSSYQVGATYTFGVSTIRASVGRDQQGSTNGFNYIGSNFNNAGTGFSGPSTMGGLGYMYALSKRTSLYTDLANTRWKYTDDQGRRSAMGYALGMTHTF